MPKRGAEKVRTLRMTDQMEAVYTADKGLTFVKKKKVVKKLRVQKMPELEEELVVKDLKIDTLTDKILKKGKLANPSPKQRKLSKENIRIRKKSKDE
jgi:hypothetical protein